MGDSNRDQPLLSGDRLTFAEVFAEELDAIDGESEQKSPRQSTESEVYSRVHSRTSALAALCLSGGGIRSATFSLGVIQGLAKNGLLQQFHYLSTVSGGGYVGSWLTAWIHQKADDPNVRDPVQYVAQELAGHADTQVDDPRLAPEVQEIGNLRAFSNYLAPRVGLLSVDVWTLAATVGRNMILNWTVLIPLSVTALALPRVVAWAAFLPHITRAQTVVATGIGLAAIAWAMTFGERHRILKIDHRPNQNRVVLLGLVPMWTAAISLSIAWTWSHVASTPFGHPQIASSSFWTDMSMVLAFGLTVATVGFLGFCASFAVNRASFDSSRLPRIWQLVIQLLAYLMVAFVVSGIVTVIARLVDHATFARQARPLIYATVAPPAFLLSFALAATVATGLGGSLISEEDREWGARFGAWILISTVAWIAVSAVVLLVPQWMASAVPLLAAAAATFGSGLISVLAGLSPKSLFRDRAKDDASQAGATHSRYLSLAVKVGLPIFIVLFMVFLSLLTDLFAALYYIRPFEFERFWDAYAHHRLHLQLAQDGFNIVIAASAAAIAIVASWGIDINKFSLHALYRNRLVRAYLGAARGKARRPDPFIGFDTNDDVALYATRRRTGVPHRLFHVVNMALNLVAGDELAWQERKADSMTASALHVGTRGLGYRRAEEYGGLRSRPIGEGGPFTLGTAMAISGAAASPNMGYHSSPVLTFVMTLFNARLGWWLGNPGVAGRQIYTRESPRFALYPLLSEAFGLTDQRHPYVYVSDGGHFENLGLYEMVRRRCGFIMVIDGGTDPDCRFKDLSAAIRKIRSDMGVPITVPIASERRIFARSDHAAQNSEGKVAFVGRIHYSAVDCPLSAAEKDKDHCDGVLLYVKPAFYGGVEPLDVIHYAGAHLTFPHQTTANQFFSESQFESYRMLGSHAVQLLTEAFPPGGSFEQLKDCVDTYLRGRPSAALL